jgi:aryl-alcohol dehydrogenase-like predicted oxidoreductase
MLETVDFGLSGLSVSPLCFGTGTTGWNGRSNQGDLGLDRLAYLLAYAHERGITFWDTADQYGTHPHVAAALRHVDRERTTITTKTVARDADGVRRDIERFLRELDTDYIDIVLLHCMTDANWPQQMRGPMDVLSQFKDEGRVLAVGVSNHDFGAFCTTAECDWVDVVLARINYAGHAMDDAPDNVAPVIEKMAQAGKGVYGMKVVGGGSELSKDPGRAIRYSMGIPGVHAVVLGMMDEDQIEENLGFVSELISA